MNRPGGIAMKAISFFSISVLMFIFGCVSENENNDVKIKTLGKCGVTSSALMKTALDSSGRIIFVSKDSLQGEFIADVGCVGSHTEKTSLPNDSTLKVDYVYPPGPVAGCACRESVTVTATSTEHDLQLISQIEFNGFTYFLK
jgi:hypothetical protein